MLNSVARFIEKHQLLSSQHRYIAALSGGADSVCLLLMLRELGYTVEAVHCNFQLRGEESNRDENFVATLCQQMGITLHRVHFDTRSYAQLHKVSIEMAARQLRYRYFEQLRRDLGAEAVCVAHHRDDSVETVLMNLLRGTGIHGLVGIRPKNGHIVRPLLCLSRQQIEDYLRAKGQSYVTDSTNLVDDVMRNKIRLNVLPLLRHIAPAAAENIQLAAEQLAEAEKIYNEYATSMLTSLVHNDSIEIKELRNTVSADTLLFEWLRGYDFTPATIRQIKEMLDRPTTGRVWHSPTHEVLIDRGRLVVEPRQPLLPTLRVPEPGTYVYDEVQRFRFATTSEVVIERSAACACLDAQKVDFPLTIRPVQEGDRFVPYGMKGSKLVSDFLTDRKLSLFARRRQLVVTNAAGTIVWLVSQRPDARFCIGPGTTQMLKIALFSV